MCASIVLSSIYQGESFRVTLGAAYVIKATLKEENGLW